MTQDEAERLVILHGSVLKASKASGIPRTTLRARLAGIGTMSGPRPSGTAERLAAKHGIAPQERVKAEITLPQFADPDISAEKILDQMEAQFGHRKEAHDSRQWFRVKVKKDQPIGIAWVGDPHLGSNGCDIAALRRDVATINKTPGMFGAMLGDVADNWPDGGRLAKLYADNDVSRKTERILATWFLDCLPWMLWLHGNHDMMHGALTAHLEAKNTALVPMLDWEAKFILEFPKGKEVRVHAAHNHKGHSMWNNLHGQMRAAKLGGEKPHIVIAGHHHDWGITQGELPGGHVYHAARARGYKAIDDHAMHHGFQVYEHGHTVVSIINPKAKTEAGLVTMFSDLSEAASYLTYLRGGK